MNSSATTGSSDSVRDASSAHLPDHIHLKHGFRADLPARATPVTDPAERQAVLAEIVADLNQPHDPGTIRPTRLEDWADSRLMRISFRHQP